MVSPYPVVLAAFLATLLACSALGSDPSPSPDAELLKGAALDEVLIDPLPLPLVQQQAGGSSNSIQRQVDNGSETDQVKRQGDEGSGDGPAINDDTEPKVDRQVNDGNKRQTGVLDCDFGANDRPTLCGYSNSNTSVLRWQTSTGQSGNWLGGPTADANDIVEGGYAFFETSQEADFIAGLNTESAMLESPLQTRTPPTGRCVQFRYHMQGLSADRLRLLLHPIDEEERHGAPSDHRSDSVLWTSSSDAGGSWLLAELLYSFPAEHTIVFEAIPKSSSGYRGHIALDSIQLATGDGCNAHCNFDGGICSWTQEYNRDHFDWQASRSSLNPKTGPPADHSSELLGVTAGGYMFVDSSPPRRPSDRARLLSPELQPTTSAGPVCLRFWICMFGPGVGTLRVLRLMGEQETELWKLSGPSGKQWYQGLVTVSATSVFKLALEAEIGTEQLGDIAIDDVSLQPGICPAAPEAAAPWFAGCTFEVDTCGWTNSPTAQNRDRGGWERVTARGSGYLPESDHTTGQASGQLMRLVYNEPQRPGHRARLESPRLKRQDTTNTATTMCLTFRYYMDQSMMSGTGFRLGSLRAWTESIDSTGETRIVQLWHLNNVQKPEWLLAQATIVNAQNTKIVLEGMWAGSSKGVIAVDDIVLLDGECEQQPPQSRPGQGDCHFTRDTCGWRNTTSDDERQQRWRAAAPLSTSAPRVLLTDHTFRASTGYVYFDVFSLQQQLRLMSPVLDAVDRDGGGRACVGFWFAHLSPSEPTMLRVLHEEVESEGGEGKTTFRTATVLWSLSASKTGARRLTWVYGQAGFQAMRRFRITFEGVASKFGFALDDITFTAGDCKVRPDNAAPDSPGDDRFSLHP